MGQKITATFQKLTKTFSQDVFDKFVAREIKKMNRLRAKGHRDWKDTSDEQIRNVAESTARIYSAGTVWIDPSAGPVVSVARGRGPRR